MFKTKVLMGLMLLLAFSVIVSADVIQVPYDTETGQYYLQFYGYTDIHSGNYDPDSMGGTFHKAASGDKWCANDWNAANAGVWEFQFVGGPAESQVETITANILFYKIASNTYSSFKLEAASSAKTVYFSNGTAYASDWYGRTLGSEDTPLNTDALTLTSTIYNGGGYETAVQVQGFEITATPVPEPTTMALICIGALGMVRRKK